MSLKVLVILEDFTYDRYVVRPMVEAILAELGRPRARVDIVTNPRMRGIDAAMNAKRLAAVYSRYPMADIFVLVVDRDADPNRRRALDNLQRQALPVKLAAEHAFQEIEVWALAGVGNPPWPWRQVRDERHAKEIFFGPYSRDHGLSDLSDEGRGQLAAAAAANYPRLRQRCKEIAGLEDRIRQLIA